jgi:site-specific DNA-cytosine methylase
MTIERNFKHGETGTRLYRAWLHVRRRCFEVNCDKYSYYGGRGITMCDAWKDSFIAFRDWAMANGYQEDLTIDRIDSNGNYEPSNCRWATIIEQANNKRSNILVKVGDEIMTVAEASRLTGINYGTLISRYRRAVKQIGNAVCPKVAEALVGGMW